MNKPVFEPAALGKPSEPSVYRYGWEAVALYALSVGAKCDEVEYIYERHGPKTLPTFALVPAMAPVIATLDRCCGGGGPRMLSRQAIRVRAPLPPRGALVCTAVARGIYDHGKFATIRLDSTTSLENGDLLVEGEWTFIFPGAGGFGGSPPPRSESPATPDRAPDWSVEDTSTPEQPFLHRIATGDLNPIHVDEKEARAKGWRDMVLQGTCTLAYMLRAVVRHAADGDASRVSTFGGEFRKPAVAGEVFRTDGWRLDQGSWALSLSAKERPEPLIRGAFATFHA